MADTTFVDYTTPAVNAAWLNDINDHVYNGKSLDDISIINVKDPAYGVVGDGVTDDTAAIAAAIADLGTGQTLYFPPGTYLVSAYILDAAIVLPANTNLFMDKDAWLTASTSFGSIIAPLGNNIITCNIDGAGYPLSGGVPGTWVIENAGIKTYYDASIGLGATDVIVCNSEIKNCTYGIHAQGAKRWRVYGNKIHRMKLSGILMGFYASYDCERNLYLLNTFEDLGDYAIAHYQVGGQSNGYLKHCTIAFNNAKNCNLRTSGYAFGVEQGSAAYQSDIAVIGNQYDDDDATGTYGHGGIVLATCTNSIAANNVLNGALGATSDIGISLYGAVNTIAVGNTITRFRGSGIYMDGSTDTKATNNKIHNCGSTSTSYPGILLAVNENTTGPEASNNHLSWDDSYPYTGAGHVAICGVTASGKTFVRPVITNNTIHNPPRVAIQLTGLVASTIDKAVVTNNITTKSSLFASSGILLDYCAYPVVRNNIMRDQGAATTFTNCTNTTISENIGYVTENKGLTAAIATGATVTHGLVSTPTNVVVTPAETGPTDVTVSAVGATTFVINFGGGGSKTFYWQASV